jgi:hypothetical protein
MKDTVRLCRKCGKPIAVIGWGIYRSSVVDPEPVMVVADPSGEDWVRPDGSKVKAREDTFGVAEGREIAYRQHRKSCGQ